MYQVDQNGPDGLWRAWWLRPDGHTAEVFFRTSAAAWRWVEFMESLAV